jgi:hypothetical protein
LGEAKVVEKGLRVDIGRLNDKVAKKSKEVIQVQAEFR